MIKMFDFGFIRIFTVYPLLLLYIFFVILTNNSLFNSFMDFVDEYQLGFTVHCPLA